MQSKTAQRSTTVNRGGGRRCLSTVAANIKFPGVEQHTGFHLPIFASDHSVNRLNPGQIAPVFASFPVQMWLDVASCVCARVREAMCESLKNPSSAGVRA